MKPAPEAITVNGKKIALTKQKGKSRGGSRRMRAMSEVPGLGRVYIVVYLEKGKRAAKAAASSPTPPVPQPSPPYVEDVQSSMLKVLQAVTRRLGALEAQMGVAIAPQPHVKRPRIHPPQPSA